MLKQSWLAPAFLTGLLAALCGCRGVSDRAAPAPTPTPDQAQAAEALFDRYAEAVGGRGAAERIRSFTMKGAFELTGVPGKLPVEVYYKRPDKSLMVIDLPRLGRLRRGRSGGSGWSQTPLTGVVEHSPNELTEVERDHDIYGAADLRRIYKEVRLDSRARLGGRDAYVVECRPAEGPAEKIFFDAETGLALRWDVVRRRPGRPTVYAHIYLEDYRQVGEVKVPFTLRYYLEPRELVLRLAEVGYDVPLDDAMFERPPGR